MNAQELQIGSVAVSVVLSIILRMVYGTWEVGPRWKPWIAVGLGMILAFVAMWVASAVLDSKAIVSFLVQGFMTGSTATGLYELTKSRTEIQ